MIFEFIPLGTYGRWAIGMIILTHLIAYNESGAVTVIFSTLIATVCAIFSAFAKSSLNHLQLPYIRATHKFDFFTLFLALWMDILTLICACGTLARTLSICLDALTGGMARIYILGRNAPVNEPWPDVIGFSIIFFISVMFMLGLENSKIFSCILVVCLFGTTCILFSIAWVRGTNATWKIQNWLPHGLNGILSSSALLVFAYPPENPTTGSCPRLIGFVICVLVGLSNALTTGCLSTVLQYSPPEEFTAVPILSILEKTDFHNFEPAVACLFVLICSSAFLELFSEMFNLIVTLTTSDWKILTRQIGYENGDSGSPVLAIFSGGSICAMIAFACPMEVMIYLVAGSQLCAGLLRIFYLFYSPFRPKYLINNNQNDTSLAYSLLNATPVKPTANVVSVATSTAAKASNLSRRIFRCLSKPKIVPIPKSKSRLKKNNRDEELEREWLLLGEPQSPRNTVILDDEHDTSSLSIEIAVAIPASTVDIESARPQVSNESSSRESDSTTDIDAIVDEYRQKVKVTTAGPTEKIMRIPSGESWKLSMVFVGLICIGTMICVIGTLNESIILFISGLLTVILLNFCICFLPRYTHSKTSPSTLFCSLAILLESILLGSTLSYSWPAIIAWIIAGILIFTRCDTWCSLCIEQQIYINHITCSSTAPSTSSNVGSIRLSRPPKGSLISSHVHGHTHTR